MSLLDKIKERSNTILNKAVEIFQSENFKLTSMVGAVVAPIVGGIGGASLAAYADKMEMTGQKMGNVMGFLADTFTTHAASANQLFTHSISNTALETCATMGFAMAGLAVASHLASKINLSGKLNFGNLEKMKNSNVVVSNKNSFSI